MALRKDNTAPATSSTAAAAAGQFEEMDTTNVGSTSAAANSDEPPAATSEASPPPSAAPAASASRAVAERVQTALSIKRDTVVASLQDLIPTDDLEAMGIGVFPRITCSPGAFNEDKAKLLGDQIVLGLASWSFVWIISTGEQNNPEANKLVRTSYDGVNLKDGEGTIADYVKYLKAEGYDKTESKRYVELYGNLVATRKGGPIAIEDQKLVQVSVSPQSVGQWGKYQLECAMRKGRGINDSNMIQLDADSKTLGANTFGVIKFSPYKG